MNKPKTILLLGSYGRGNIGDDVFLESAVSLLKNRNLYVNSANDKLLPGAAQGKVKTIQTNGYQDTIKKLQLFQKLTHVVYWGGDLWVELYGNRFPRQALYKMVVLNIAARLFGKKVYYIGCGIGKLSGYSLFLARLAARLAEAIVVREARSAQLLGVRHIRVLPDLAINLPIFHRRSGHNRRSKSLTIGISVLYFLPNPDKNFPKLLSHLERLCAHIGTRHRFVLLPMLTSKETKHDDVWASKQLQKRLSQYRVRLCAARDIHEYMKELSRLDLVIGTRLHANILATLAGTPCIGISYRPKVAEFFKQHGLEKWCVPLGELSRLPELWQQFKLQQPEVKRDFGAAQKNLLAQRHEYEAFVDEHF